MTFQNTMRQELRKPNGKDKLDVLTGARQAFGGCGGEGAGRWVQEAYGGVVLVHFAL